jgi:hypothetical protein
MSYTQVFFALLWPFKGRRALRTHKGITWPLDTDPR